MRQVIQWIFILGIGWPASAPIHSSALKQATLPTKITGRIYYHNSEEERALRALNFEIQAEKPGEYMDVLLTFNELIKLQFQGWEVALMIELNFSRIDSQYHTFSEVQSFLTAHQQKWSSRCWLDSIGVSTTGKLPILAIRISDNPCQDADEPAILITGAHHGREPLSTEVCLYLIENLVQNYASDPEIRTWIDATEIWLVPVVNPDGYNMVFNPDRRLSGWRKNLRDNNGNGRFDPDSDGVDLNRNYDYNWESGGSTDLTSTFYRGPAPFSESETTALKNFIEKKRFAYIIDLHSFGETVLFPWGNLPTVPEQELMSRLARQLADKIAKKDQSGAYTVIPLDGKMGQSSVWYYGRLGIPGLMIEVGDSYFPPGIEIPALVQACLPGFYFLFKTLHQTRLTGHVYDARTQQPLVAEIQIWYGQQPYTRPFQTQAQWGRFDRILAPGKYEIRIQANGYQPLPVDTVEMAPGQITEKIFRLEPCILKPPVPNE